MSHTCKSIGCRQATDDGNDFCNECAERAFIVDEDPSQKRFNWFLTNEQPSATSERTHLDVYAVHHLFGINDPSGCVQHASRKLLQSCMQGDRPSIKDITEARDILSRWLELNKETTHET